MNIQSVRAAFSTGTLLLLAVTFPAFARSSESSAAGLEHFYKVDDHLYRGAQPTEEGFNSLAKMGVKTVIDLREATERSDWEERLVKNAGMRYISVPIAGLAAPTADQMRRMLRVINDPAAGPVFVHCKRGKDRTGAVVACYRVEHDHWDNAKALKEARHLGMSWFEFPKQQFVMAFRPGGVPEPTIVPVGVPALIAPATAQ